MQLRTHSIKLDSRNAIKITYNIIFFSLLFAVSFFFFRYVSTFFDDYAAHFNAIGDVVSGHWRLPHVGFEYTAYAIARVLHVSLSQAGFIELSFFFTASCYFIFWLLKKFTPVNDLLAGIFTLSLCLISAIYLPFINPNFYLGQGSPNLWHNPPLIIVKLFVFLVVFFSIQAVELKEKKYWFLVSLFLFLSLLYKPVFGIVFIPGFMVFLVLTQGKKLKPYFFAALAFLPSCVLSIFQYYFTKIYFDQAINKSAFALGWFVVLKYYSHHLVISLLSAIAFPLLLAVFRFKQIFVNNNYLKLTWILLVVAYMQAAFLYENSSKIYDANFTWGYSLVLSLLFVFSFIEYIKWIAEKKTRQVLVVRTEQLLVGSLFLLNLFSGIFYVIRIYTTHFF